MISYLYFSLVFILLEGEGDVRVKCHILSGVKGRMGKLSPSPKNQPVMTSLRVGSVSLSWEDLRLHPSGIPF